MKRRDFMICLAATACSGGETVTSVIPETVPGDTLQPWPEAQIDSVAVDTLVDEALSGTGLEDSLGELGTLVDEELRAVASIAPNSAKLGAATIETMILPVLEVVCQIREAPEDMSQDELGALMASTFDLSGLEDTMLPLIEASRAELEDVGVPTQYGRSLCTNALRGLATDLRAQLAVAGRDDNPFARQLVLELDRLALMVDTDMEGLFDAAAAALDGAPSQPLAPPFASFCTNTQYVQENWDRRLVGISAYMNVIGSTGWLFTRYSLMATLVGIGVVGLMMPFLLYRPPTIYIPVFNYMCACEV